jgi:hypothetical protein
VKPRNELTDEQKALFDSRIAYWQDALGLKDWRVERSKRRTNSMADVKLSFGARLASYTTGDFGSAPITPESINETALHEMLHVLLAELLHLTGKTNDAELLEAAEHRVVNVLEKLLR